MAILSLEHSFHRPLVLAAGLFVTASCATESPLDRLQRQLERYPEYSVTLQDMRPDGYWHQYRVVVGESRSGSPDLSFRDAVLDWQPVGRQTYDRYLPHLGMVILSKGPDGTVDLNEHPPGYQQVGNERYGQWRNDERGNSFWVFYGQYAMLSHMVGGFGRPIYRNDWNAYQGARGRGQTYYGRGGVYGTNGSATRQTNPDFFRRQQARQVSRNRSFGERVRGRMLGGGRGFGK